MIELPYPIRINHYLAAQKLTTRRGADALIRQGKVRVNGLRAVLGQKIQKGDIVTIDEKTQTALQNNRIFLAYHKPVGVVSHSPQKNEKAIGDILPFDGELFPIGRLDKDSHGLMILTNDGRITSGVLDPNREHEKEYLVKVNQKIRRGFLARIREGMTLDDYRTKPAMAEKLNDTSFRIILTEGKNRQIRKMCAAFNYQIHDLKRVRIMNIRLGNLQPNQYRILGGVELQEFLKTLGL